MIRPCKNRNRKKHYIDGRYMVFNATFNNMSAISCQSVLLVSLVDETRVHGEKHRPVGTPHHEQDSNSQR